MSYYIPLSSFNIKKQNYDTSAIGEGFEALRKSFKERQEEERQRAIGEKMAAGDMAGAEKEAFSLADLNSGLAIRRQRFNEEDRSYNRGLKEQEVAEERAKMARSSEEAERKSADFHRKRISNAITTLDPSNPEYKSQYQTLIGTLRQMGQPVPAEFDDPDTGYRLALSEVTDYKDRTRADLDRRKTVVDEREVAMKERESLSKANRNDLLAVLRAVSSANTPEKWEQAQGVIQAVYGRTFPFEQRSSLYQQANDAYEGGDKLAPSPEEEELGITRDLKKDALRNKALTDMYGDPGKGKRWIVDQNGRLRSDADPSEEAKNKGIMSFHLNQLNDAEKTMTNSSFVGRTVGQALDMGEVGQAINNWHSAILGLVYERSGKQTAVAEMKQWLDTYGPKIGDGNWRLQQKINNAKAFYRQLAGESLPGGPGSDSKSMSDEELLRELQK